MFMDAKERKQKEGDVGAKKRMKLNNQK